MGAQCLLDKLDEETKDNIAKALWMREFNAEEISDELFRGLGSEKNSNENFGDRMQYLLKEKINNPDSFTPNYKDVYGTLIKNSSSLSPHQAYAMTFFLGMDSSKGYKAIPGKADFKLLQDDAPQWDYQLGWHFIVGSCMGDNGKEYGVQFMFWQYALLPPEIAKHFGLSDIENQIIELHLAVSEAGGEHYRSKPILIAGTTGLVDFKNNPFEYTFGKNKIRSLSEDSTFPMQIKGWGVDLDPDSQSEIEVDITLTQTKEYLLQGKDGCDPCCGGVGTLYYSVPNLRVDPDKSTLRINEEEIALKSGKFWYDHQWCNGMIPAGNPRVKVLRAANNMNEKATGGWDWFMAQFKGNRELTMASVHSHDMLQFLNQTGPNPPKIMEAEVSGKYIDENNNSKKIKGQIKITEWIRSVKSQDPDLYPPTNTWYPQKWEFSFGEDIPEDIQNFVMIPIVSGGQSGFFGNGLHYSEGAVYLKDNEGNSLGRGFAESTGYADPLLNRLKLAGLPATEEMRDKLEIPQPQRF
ncbi:lipocalin-like domain-containing protein [Methanobacterium sp. SMA-27]|uniref:lipocalin-like domain-containing protein n=1 Tax=Methanobacterium sp. SMA-27 TaxID=1495336 RepID=UPI00064F9664|nr:lipocalin-like domain-containing protein [Methanobacterium sp. SMA-27]